MIGLDQPQSGAPSDTLIQAPSFISLSFPVVLGGNRIASARLKQTVLLNR